MRPASVVPGYCPPIVPNRGLSWPSERQLEYGGLGPLRTLPGGRFALKTGGRLSAGNYSAVDLLDIRQVDFSQGIVDLIDVLSDEGWLGHRIEERVAQIHETVDGSRNQGLRKSKHLVFFVATASLISPGIA